jgi:hypothetical protein
MVAETRLVAAAYPAHLDAQTVVKELREQGVEESEISIIYTDAGHRIKAGLLSGAIWGGAMGAFLGLLFPPVGVLVVAGPIVGELLSGAGLAAFGAITVGAFQGVITALVQVGLPREMATKLGEHVQKGDALVIVHAPNEAVSTKAKQIMQSHHPRPEASPTTDGVVSTAGATR